MLRDHNGNFVAICSKKLVAIDANLGEAHATLLATKLVVSFSSTSLIIERDSLLTIIAIKDPQFSSWASYAVISYLQNVLLSIPVWSALKTSRCANFCAHQVAKWAASHFVFGNIPTSSHFLSSIRVRSGKDPPLYLFLLFPFSFI
jgi:hypothetical protein